MQLSSRVRQPGRATSRGFTLVEVLIAIFTLAIAVVAGYRTLSQSQLATVGIKTRVLALQVATNEAELMRLVRHGEAATSINSVEMGGLVFAVRRSQEATRGGLRKITIHAIGPDGSGASVVSFLPQPGA